MFFYRPYAFKNGLIYPFSLLSADCNDIHQSNDTFHTATNGTTHFLVLY